MADDTLEAFCCPIGKFIMTDPVIATDGHSYERDEILSWFETHQTSPMTNLPLTSRHLVRNYTLKKAIDEYRDRKQLMNVPALPTSCQHQACNCDNIVQVRLDACIQKEKELQAAVHANQKTIEELIRFQQRRFNAVKTNLKDEREVVNQLRMAMDNMEREQKRQRHHEDDDVRLARRQEEEERRRQQQLEEANRRQRQAEEERQRREEEIERQRREASRAAALAKYWHDNFIRVSDSEYRCLVCDVREHINNRSQMMKHIHGARHGAVVESYMLSNGGFYCQTCDSMCNSRHNFVAHVAGGRHRANVENQSCDD